MNKVILYDDPIAAEKVNMDLWKSVSGRLFVQEHDARVNSMTHSLCKTCGGLTQRHFTLCGNCRSKVETEKFFSLPEEPYTGGLVYSESRDKYFADLCTAEDSLDEDESLEDLRLVHCKPNKPILAEDHFSHLYPDSDDYDDSELQELIEQFNKAAANITLSWYPTKVRVALTPDADVSV